MELKKQLHTRCVEIIQKRIHDATQAMNDAQESANQEEKSSAGDKYETGRAMAQIARNQAAQQLNEAIKLKEALEQINPGTPTNKVTLGSLVITDGPCFYISVSAGKIEMDGKEYFSISPQSPIGKVLMTRSIGDVVTLNKQQHVIRLIQ